MAELAALVRENPALIAQAAILARPGGVARRMADAVRALAIDAVEVSKSGHPGMPLGMADVASVLWGRSLKFDAADPRWPDRDRFVLSAGHGSILLHALLHLTGHEGMGIEELRRFRQLHSAATGHPEFGVHPAIEATTGPAGQGFAAAVGMAIAERMLAARFGRSLVDHRTWVIASDGDLMEGLSHEAASLAGHLRLGKLAVLYDENGISADGDTRLVCSDDPARRFAAYGWAVKQVDGHDPAQVAASLSFAIRSARPTLIVCRTILGFAAPTKAGTVACHAEPLGPGEAQAAKEALGWHHMPFTVPGDIAEQWRAVGARGAIARRAWLKRLARHPLRPEFERVIAGRLPDSWHEAVATLKARMAATRPALPTRQASLRVMEALAPAIPELAGGSAEPYRTDAAPVTGMTVCAHGQYGGRTIHFGLREHAMAACLNGMALHGGVLPFGRSFLAHTDYMRPALRLAALMRRRVIHVVSHDSIGLGGDGPAHQPVEHLASLRALPGTALFRPADAVETVECWELALRRADGPSLLVLSRQAVPALRSDVAENRCARGGYVLAEAEGPRRATLIASGSEVAIALTARMLLAAEGIATAVVSLPCWQLFGIQDEAYRVAVLGHAPRFGIEAATSFGWERWLGENGVFIGMEGFGASGAGDDLYRHFGITPEAIAQAVRRKLG
jgi:transketolase